MIIYEQIILIFSNFTFYKRIVLKLFFIYIMYLFFISSYLTYYYLYI